MSDKTITPAESRLVDKFLQIYYSTFCKSTALRQTNLTEASLLELLAKDSQRMAAYTHLETNQDILFAQRVQALGKRYILNVLTTGGETRSTSTRVLKTLPDGSEVEELKEVTQVIPIPPELLKMVFGGTMLPGFVSTGLAPNPEDRGSVSSPDEDCIEGGENRLAIALDQSIQKMLISG